MKKAFVFCMAVLSGAALLAGCGASGESAASPENTGVLLTAKTTSDLEEVAYTLTDLVEASDFIATVQVAETHEYVYPDTTYIQTQITPQVLTVYKGTYNGEFLEIEGGCMDYNDYTSAPIFQQESIQTFDVSSYSVEELDTARVYEARNNGYVPQAGDTLLFFGKQADADTYYVTYGYQGVFVLQDGSWYNPGLVVEENDWQEPLVTDLLTRSGAAVVESPAASVQTIGERIYTLPSSDYDTILIIPEETLLTAILEETPTAS